MALQPQRSPYDQSLPLPPGGPQNKLGQVAPPADWADQQPGREMANPAVRPVPGLPPSREDRPLTVDRRPTPQQAPDKQKPAGPAPAAGAAAQNGTGQQPTEPPAEATTAEATVAPSANAPPPSPAVEEVEFSLSELRSQAALQSSESQGAAIVLTLGVLLSAILVVLALCRTQCARRRGRRGDRPGLAHDADYLVNGMYL
ncbi:synapsin-1-like isoform X2 [Amphibalanus amphitrite]|uniref:synapsin-1-like isoform X2 n=1 Tax=Amphibalanus amphitrite TaxID=1232801 RepID=UPI001C91E485|nr:synapsin-1-like isoform X2 [Amphibalanus amphitrite]